MDDWQAPSSSTVAIIIVIILIVVGIIILIIALWNSGSTNGSGSSIQADDKDDDDEDDSNGGETIVIGVSTDGVPLKPSAPANIAKPAPQPVKPEPPKPQPVKIEPVKPQPPKIEPPKVVPVVASDSSVPTIEEMARNVDLASVEDFDSSRSGSSYVGLSSSSECARDSNPVSDPSRDVSATENTSQGSVPKVSCDDILNLSKGSTPDISDIADSKSPNDSTPNISDILGSGKAKDSIPTVSDLVEDQKPIAAKDISVPAVSSGIPATRSNPIRSTAESKIPAGIITAMNAAEPSRPVIPQPPKIAPYASVAIASPHSSVIDETSGLSIDASMTNPVSMSSDFSSLTEKSVRAPRKRSPPANPFAGIADLAKPAPRGRGRGNGPKMGPL